MHSNGHARITAFIVLVAITLFLGSLTYLRGSFFTRSVSTLSAITDSTHTNEITRIPTPPPSSHCYLMPACDVRSSTTTTLFEESLSESLSVKPCGQLVNSSHTLKWQQKRSKLDKCGSGGGNIGSTSMVGGQWRLPCRPDTCAPVSATYSVPHFEEVQRDHERLERSLVCDWTRAVWEPEQCVLEHDRRPHEMRRCSREMHNVAAVFVWGDSTVRGALNGLLSFLNVTLTEKRLKTQAVWQPHEHPTLPWPLLHFAYQHLHTSTQLSDFPRPDFGIDFAAIVLDAARTNRTVIVVFGGAGSTWYTPSMLTQVRPRLQAMYPSLNSTQLLHHTLRFVFKSPQFSATFHALSTPTARTAYLASLHATQQQAYHEQMIYMDSWNITAPVWPMARPFNTNCFCHTFTRLAPHDSRIWGPVNEWRALMLERALCVASA